MDQDVEVVEVRTCTAALLVILAWLALSACATAYQPMGATGGFSELQLSADIYRVAFRGNGYTPPDRVIDFALLRAAEICLERGARHFVVLNEGRDTSQQLVGGGHTTGTMTPTIGGGYSVTGTTSVPVLVRRHSAELVIRLVNDQAPPGGPAVFSAELIRDQVRQKFGAVGEGGSRWIEVSGTGARSSVGVPSGRLRTSGFAELAKTFTRLGQNFSFSGFVHFTREPSCKPCALA